MALTKDEENGGPESTSVRVALWRAMHVEVDAPPHVFNDEIGARLAAAGEGWRQRPDMDQRRTMRSRGSVVARSRFIEDLIEEEVGSGVGQYVILGAGLDSFSQRRPELAAKMRVFEVDQAGPQAWKRKRLLELGFGIPEWLRLVPVDFEVGEKWWGQLVDGGLDVRRPAVVSWAGVSMYLTRAAIERTLKHVASLAPGSKLAMTFQLPLELIDLEERAGREATEKFARMAGTPFISFFAPSEMMEMARKAGFKEVRHVSSESLGGRYFAGRQDGLRPSSAEELLIAGT